jgi:hypothetical protein
MLEDAQCVPAVSECAGTLSAQKQIAANTAARGYRDGWTAEQFAARQVCKLVEELGELCASTYLPRFGWHPFENEVIKIGEWAKHLFDDGTAWDDKPADGVGINSDEAKSELVDIVVVALNLAETLAEITGEPFDVVAAALKKSKADIGRGVR